MYAPVLIQNIYHIECTIEVGCSEGQNFCYSACDFVASTLVRFR